ncbi:MAG TPA: hypothetical protein VGJ60_21435 [Chloroflexota bacterium]
MSITLERTQDCPGTADAPSSTPAAADIYRWAPAIDSRSLTQLHSKDMGLVGLAVLTGGFSIFAFFANAWWVHGLVALFWIGLLAVQRIWSRLEEPITFVSNPMPRAGEALVAQCEFRAKKLASVAYAEVDIVCVETHGEDNETTHFGPWLIMSSVELGTEPATVQRTIPMPTAYSRRWRRSGVSWSLTLHIRIDGGLDVRRSYSLKPLLS